MGGTVVDGAAVAGPFFEDAAEAIGADDVSAPADEAEGDEPIEPSTEDDGAVGDDPGVAVATGPDEVAALVVWFPPAASAIWAAPATAANPAATA